MRGASFILLALVAVALAAPASASAATRLIATVGPRSTISLKTEGGVFVKSIKAGEYDIVVRDRSRLHNFHLIGPAGTFGRRSSVRAIGTLVWKVQFIPATYRFRCDRHPSRMNGSFKVV